MKLYPAIDLLGGRCVRLHQGQFDQATVYSDDPRAMAASFAAAGATHLHIVDLDGSRDGALSQAGLIKDIIASSALRVQVGGGIRTLAAATAYRQAGVERIVLGSMAARDPVLALQIAQELGPEHITLALDVRPEGAGYAIAVQGWTERAAVAPWDLLERFLAAGVRRILCTDISRDGALTGPNLALYEDLLRRFPRADLLGSGGVATLADLQALAAHGAYGAIVGKALYAGRFTLTEALACCANA